MLNTAQTMFEKVWNRHIVHEATDEPTLLYVDLHLIHEVSSPQAFDGLRASRQIAALRQNCAEFGIELVDLDSEHQGIVHVIGPELGATKPGMTIVCGDSHASTHGTFGALAFGIGTSEVEHVLALQCLPQAKPQTFRITVDGAPAPGVGAKDIILNIIGQIGTAGATCSVIEYAGAAIRGLTMEGRMTVCNMSIEAGARAGMIAPDEKTFAYLKGRPFSPAGDTWEQAITQWKVLPSDPGASFDKELHLDASTLSPCVTWGTSPGMVVPITACVPEPPPVGDPERVSHLRALQYMNLRPGTPMESIAIDRVFIGSCTNSRLEDLRDAAEVVCGYRLALSVRGLVVPGSQQVKVQAEAEGLHHIFQEAGFEWREASCSMCLGMNPDSLEPGERCASTSNRNFEGRQGRGSRSHLLSPRMAAAAAITGKLTDVRHWTYRSTTK